MSLILTAILLVGFLTGAIIWFIIIGTIISRIAIEMRNFVDDLYINLKNWWARR